MNTKHHIYSIGGDSPDGQRLGTHFQRRAQMLWACEFLILSTLLILIFPSCEKTKEETIVGWKTITHFEENPVIIDTIEKTPYNFKSLLLINKIDSLLRSNCINLKDEAQEFLIDGYEISVGRFSTFKSTDEVTKYSKINIYHNDWPWNQHFISSRNYGVVALFPSHSRKRYLLDFKVVGNDTVFKLDNQLLLYFQEDTVLNPIPPMPEKLPEIIEVPEEIEVLIE